MSELNQEEQQQEEVRENSEQDTLKLGVSRRTFIGAGMTAAAAALVLPRQAQGITELIEDHGAGAEDLGLQPGEKVGIKDIYKPVAFCSPVFSVPPNQWKFNRDPGSRTAPVDAPHKLEARKATLTYTGIPYEPDICNAPQSADKSAEVRVFYDPDCEFRDMEVLLGPTLVCDRGGIIDFELTNYLPAQDFDEASCHELHEDNLIEGSSEQGCFEEFSMHFHGLHVSPISGTCQNTSGEEIEFSSDHIFAPLVPDKGEDYPLGPEGELLYTKRRFRLAIPEFHAPGTHWYHTHLHGTTAVQTSNGMAGAIIIPEPDGERKLGVNDKDDRIWLIQEFVADLFDDDVPQDEEFYIRRIRTDGGQKPGKGLFLVNGQYVPTLNITAGCPQRWRFINATGTPRGPMQLKLYKLTEQFENCTLDELHEMLWAGPNDESSIPPEPVGNQEAMYLIAVDGISFYGHNPQKVPADNNSSDQFKDYKEGWKFAPGNRADFLVNLQAGKYYVLRDQYMKLDDDDAGVGNQYKSKKTGFRQVLGFINVEVETSAPSFNSNLSDVEIVGDRPNYLRPICDNELQNSPVDNVGCMNKPRIIDFAVKTADEGDPRRGLYEINRKQFKDVPNEVAPIKVGLNTAERWLLRNINCELNENCELNDRGENGSCRKDENGDSLGYKYQGTSAPHPFHIHVNPFQVEGELIDPSKGDGPSNWRWRDVLAVDFEKHNPEDENPVPKSMCVGPDTVLGEFGENANDHYAEESGIADYNYAQKEYEDHTKYKMIRNRFADFDGEYVVHCHILIHEDQGMMRKLIVGDADYFAADENDKEFTVEPGVVRYNESTDDTCPTA